MFEQPKPSLTDKAQTIRTEYDSRAPKLRLSIFAYLLDAGLKPKEIKTVDEFWTFYRDVVEFVTENTHEYSDEIAALGDAPDADNLPDDIIDDLGGKGYL